MEPLGPARVVVDGRAEQSTVGPSAGAEAAAVTAPPSHRPHLDPEAVELATAVAVMAVALAVLVAAHC